MATVNGSSPRMHVFGKWTNVEITVYVMYSSPDQLDSYIRTSLDPYMVEAIIIKSADLEDIL